VPGIALNGRVLLLNQTYEPLGTVSVARAIIMTFKNTVFVEEFDGDRVLRSAHDEFPVPSVIRRREYINVRQRRERSGMKRLRIYMRDKFRCQYCGEKKDVADGATREARTRSALPLRQGKSRMAQVPVHGHAR
jgi:hypothetical protein